jgi:methylaspartate mutase epsilon subunit
MNRYSIVLGGIGGDSHSVGIILLRRMLNQNGYRVVYLGTQNPIESFLAIAPMADVVMVSCVDGHAHHYLREFPKLNRSRPSETLWYLGGHPALDDFAGAEIRFREMGFHRVYVRFVELAVVVEHLATDLGHRVPRRGAIDPVGLFDAVRVDLGSLSDDGRIDDADHDRERIEVLQHWPTGQGALDLRDNAGFLKGRLSLAAAEVEVATRKRPMLVQPRTGVASPGEQLALFSAMAMAGATVLSYQIDSLTRNNDYAEAAEGIRHSREAGVSTINGFPAVNHGVPVLRRIALNVDRPLQFRHSTRDPRLLAEIGFAGGVSGFEGGAICYNIPYYKDYPLADAIKNWRYVDRLVGRYFDKFGLILHREFFGVLTGTLIPPCLAIATGILEALLAAQQGVRALGIGYAEQGWRAQDIAAVRSIPKLAKRVLDNFGYGHVSVGAVFHQYMAAFPNDVEKARQLICGSAATAQLSMAVRLLTKTPAEAVRIPSMADNLDGLALVAAGMSEALPDTANERSIREEEGWIEREVMAILDRVIEIGRGNVGSGIIGAFKSGAIDIPFAPSRYNLGEAITARDSNGAVRFLSCGRLPLPPDVKQFHAECMTGRLRRSRVDERHDYRVIEEDLLRIARGQFDKWPL